MTKWSKYGRAAAVLAAVQGCAAPAPEEEVGTSSSAVNNGTIVSNNTVRAVHLRVPPDTNPDETDSANLVNATGALLSTGPENSAILTAGHVLVGPKGRRRRVSSMEVELEKQSTADESLMPVFSIPHPSFLVSTPDRQAEVAGLNLNKILALDLGVLLTTSSTTQPGFVNPISTQPASSLSGSQVDIFGYGGLFFNDPGSPGLNTFSGSIAAVDVVRMPGSGAGPIGFVFDLGPGPDPQNPQFILGGDSGGPVTVKDSMGRPVIVGVNSIGPKDQRSAKISRIVSISGMGTWLQAAASSEGRFLESNFNLSTRMDQMFIVPGATSWTVHVELGEGGRSRIPVTPPAGLAASNAPFPKVAGRFDDQGDLDVVALAPGALAVQILNPTSSAAQAKLLSNNAYQSVTALRGLNNDGFTDLEGARFNAPSDFYFGGPNGLEGPFVEGAFDTCRSGGQHRANACGSKAVAGSCWCSPDCGTATGRPCCADAPQICGQSAAVLEPLLQQTTALVATSPISADAPSNGQPVATITTPSGTLVGTFLSPRWLVTAALPADTDPNDLTVRQQGGSGSVIVQSIVNHPDAPLSFLKLPNSSNLKLPSDQRMPLFTGTAAELTGESAFTMFTAGMSNQVTSIPLPTAAAFVANASDFQAELDVGVVKVSGLFAGGLAVALGSPLIGANDQGLAGINVQKENLSITVPGGAVGASASLPLEFDTQVPLVRQNLQPADARPSARYFLDQLVERDRLRDANTDGLQDLWVFQKPTTEFLPGYLALPFTSLGVAAADAVGAQGLDRDGNWRLVGRGRMGHSAEYVVWHEIDTGDIEITQLDAAGAPGDTLRMNVAPPWQLRALGDINGDGVDDLLWSNTLFDTNFFWLMRDLDNFTVPPLSLSELTSHPADAVLYGQWFNGLPVADDGEPGVFELVGADHFATAADDGFRVTGPEQAAVDLVWQEIGRSATQIWPMTFTHRRCQDIGDELIRANCGSDPEAVLTYELARPATTLDRPAHWRFSGTGDFNDDGKVDLVWHARGADAPADELGHVQLWLAQDDGEFEERTVTRAGAPLVLDPAEELEVAVR